MFGRRGKKISDLVNPALNKGSLSLGDETDRDQLTCKLKTLTKVWEFKKSVERYLK